MNFQQVYASKNLNISFSFCLNCTFFHPLHYISNDVIRAKEYSIDLNGDKMKYLTSFGSRKLFSVLLCLHLSPPSLSSIERMKDDVREIMMPFMFSVRVHHNLWLGLGKTGANMDVRLGKKLMKLMPGYETVKLRLVKTKSLQMKLESKDVNILLENKRTFKNVQREWCDGSLGK